MLRAFSWLISAFFWCPIPSTKKAHVDGPSIGATLNIELSRAVPRLDITFRMGLCFCLPTILFQDLCPSTGVAPRTILPRLLTPSPRVVHNGSIPAGASNEDVEQLLATKFSIAAAANRFVPLYSAEATLTWLLNSTYTNPKPLSLNPQPTLYEL